MQVFSVTTIRRLEAASGEYRSPKILPGRFRMALQEAGIEFIHDGVRRVGGASRMHPAGGFARHCQGKCAVCKRRCPSGPKTISTMTGECRRDRSRQLGAGCDHEGRAGNRAFSRSDRSRGRAGFFRRSITWRTSMVLAGPKGKGAVWRPLEAFLARANIAVAAFDREQAQAAREAFLRFGKGRHPAGAQFRRLRGLCAREGRAARRCCSRAAIFSRRTLRLRLLSARAQNR